MANAIREGGRLQVGKEVTPGTLVAATRRLLGSTVSFNREQEQETFEDHVSGTLARVVRKPLITRNGTLLEYTAPLSFQEVLLIGLLGIDGAATPVAADPEFTWTFDPLVTALPGQLAYTFEWVEDDLAGNAYEVEAGFGFLESAEITGGVEGVPEMTLNIRMRKSVESTMTGALTVPTEETAPNLLWKHFIADDWASLGVDAVQITGQILEFTWTYTSGLTARYYQDGRTDLDFSAVQAGKRGSDLVITAAIGAQSGSFVRSEQAHKDAGTMRFHRLQIDGDDIDTNPFSIAIDGAYYHAADSMSERGEDEDGVMTTTVHLVSGLDTVSSRQERITVVTDQETFP
jgi:hypothetical protein